LIVEAGQMLGHFPGSFLALVSDLRFLGLDLVPYGILCGLMVDG
jgi:hypothetical protein